jgi:hypothetical protein
MASSHRRNRPGATPGFSLSRARRGTGGGTTGTAWYSAPALVRKKRKHPLKKLPPAKPIKHRRTTQNRIIVDNILWYRSRGSEPSPLDKPCITLAEAQRMRLIPPNLPIVGAPDVCLAYNIEDGHPVLVIYYANTPPGTVPPDFDFPTPPQQPAGAYRLNGEPYYGPFATDWTSKQITDELSAGFVGAILDCWSQSTPDEQDRLIQGLGEDANIRERADLPPDSPPPEPDDDDTTGTPSPRAQDADRDADTQAMYDFLKGLACDLLAWLYSDSCETDSDALASMLNAATVLSHFCQHQLLDDIQAKIERCEAQPEPRSPTEEEALEEPEPETPPEPPEPIAHGGCACQTWPGWIICPNCTGDPYHCTCPGDCIPFDASSRNC